MKKLIAALALCVAGTAAQSAVVAYTWEENGNVHSSWSGSLDLTGLTHVPHPTVSTEQVRIQAHRTYFIALPRSYDAWDGYTVTGAPIGSSRTAYTNGTFTGHGFGYLTDRRRLYLPDGYQNGTEFSGTSTIFGLSLASVGVTSPKTVRMTWGDESITHHYGVRTPAVPLPAGLPLALTALGALYWMRRKA